MTADTTPHTVQLTFSLTFAGAPDLASLDELRDAVCTEIFEAHSDYDLPSIMIVQASTD